MGTGGKGSRIHQDKMGKEDNNDADEDRAIGNILKCGRILREDAAAGNNNIDDKAGQTMGRFRSRRFGMAQGQCGYTDHGGGVGVGGGDRGGGGGFVDHIGGEGFGDRDVGGRTRRSRQQLQRRRRLPCWRRIRKSWRVEEEIKVAIMEGGEGGDQNAMVHIMTGDGGGDRGRDPDINIGIPNKNTITHDHAWIGLGFMFDTHIYLRPPDTRIIIDSIE